MSAVVSINQGAIDDWKMVLQFLIITSFPVAEPIFLGVEVGFILQSLPQSVYDTQDTRRALSLNFPI